jgi:hypothetical protein
VVIKSEAAQIIRTFAPPSPPPAISPFFAQMTPALCVLLPLLALVAAPAAANSVSSFKWKNTDFVGVATADLHLPVVEGELLMLSKGIPNGAAAAWLAHPHMLSNGFSLSFSFRALIAQSMDGFAVVFQSDPAQSRALGKPGENLGYAGLKSSVAIGVLWIVLISTICASSCTERSRCSQQSWTASRTRTSLIQTAITSAFTR